VPDTSSDEYQSVADLIKEVTDAHGKGEVPYGNSWEIILPTDLVAIREESGSPEWEYKDNRWTLKVTAAVVWPAIAAGNGGGGNGGGGHAVEAGSASVEISSGSAPAALLESTAASTRIGEEP
jgi:hypothetical protein